MHRMRKSELPSHQLYEAPEFSPSYACGWAISEREWGGGKVLSHNRSNTTFYAVLWIALERFFAAMAVTHSGTPEAAQTFDSAVSLLIRWHLPVKL